MIIRGFLWSNKPKSKTGYLRSKQVERRYIQKWANRLRSSYGVQLVVVESGHLLNGFDLHQYMVTNGKRAAFDRTRATFLYNEALHTLRLRMKLIMQDIGTK